MNRAAILSVVWALAIFPVVRGDDKEDAKALEGTWVPVSGELAGQKFPDEILKTMKLVVKDGKYTVTAGPQADKGTTKIDSSKKPKTMDITGEDGPNKGKTFLAIYEITKDELKVCYDLSGKERPTEFKTKDKSLQFLAVYKREKQ